MKEKAFEKQSVDLTGGKRGKSAVVFMISLRIILTIDWTFNWNLLNRNDLVIKLGWGGP